MALAGSVSGKPALLAGIRVLDLSRVFAGPFATQMLADFGADVIKIERPGSGDESRQQGARVHDAEGHEVDYTAPYLSMNRGKQSVTVDIATTEGREIVRGLALQSDVLVENFKVGDLKRHGLDYKALHALNPRLVYCSVTGFGQTGPRAHEPGYDLVFQAMSGVMSMTGHPDGSPGGGPQRVGYSVSDITAAYHAVIAILGALYARQIGSCEGQHIDIALLDAQVAAASHVSMSYLATGRQPQRLGAASHFMVPYQPFDCSDAPLVVLCGNDAQFRRLASVLGRPDLADDPRYATNPDRLKNRVPLIDEIAAIISQRTRDEWSILLTQAAVPCAPVNDLEAAFADPQLVHRGMVMERPFSPIGTLKQIANPVVFSETPVRYDRPPPALGEHTDNVCANLLGISAERLSALRRAGII